MPQWLSGLGIDGFQRVGIVGKEDEASGGGHGSPRGPATADLRVAPSELLRSQVKRKQKPLTFFSGDMFYAGGVVGDSLGKFLGLAVVSLTLFQCLEIEHVSDLVIGGSVPIGGACIAGTDAGSGGAGCD